MTDKHHIRTSAADSSVDDAFSPAPDLREEKIGDLALQKAIEREQAEARAQAEAAAQKRRAVSDDEVLGKAYDSRIAGRLIGYTTPYKAKIALSVLCLAFVIAGNLVSPLLIQHTIDTALKNRDGSLLVTLAAAYAGVALVVWLASYAQVYIMAGVGQAAIYTIRMQMYRHLQTLSLGFFDRRPVGTILSRVQNDVGVLNEFLAFTLVGSLSDIVSLLGIIVIMLTINWQLALITFIVLPMMIIGTVIWRRRARNNYRDVRTTLGRVNADLAEAISGVRVTQAFAREDQNLRNFDRTNRANLEAGRQAALASAFFFPSVDFFGDLAAGLVVVFGGMAVFNQQLSAGAIVAFLLYVERFFNPIRTLSQRYNTMQAAMASGERIFDLMDTAPQIVESRDAAELPPVHGAVRFDHVDFNYRRDPNAAMVLADFSLNVQLGQTVALVGETGAGKSSIVNLLPRFYEILNGSITIDGHDIRSVTFASLRRQIGMVLQDTFLFSGTIADNIAYGRPDATPAQIREAAEAVGADGFIGRLPQGYDTLIGERGTRLSVGQRQLVSFARALLADPRILILDEATSSIDTHSEKIIQVALARLLVGRTAFVIAHRLSTIRDADMVVVLSHGRIVEKGTHDELLARRGAYYNLYSLQFAHAT